MPVAYGATPDSMPDKHGNPVRIGDFVRNEQGEIWRVTGLLARQEHEPEHVTKMTGMLDLEYSSFDVERPVKLNDESFKWGNLEPVVQTSVSIPKATRVDDARLADEYERLAIANGWAMVDHWEGKLAAKRSELTRREEALARKTAE